MIYDLQGNVQCLGKVIGVETTVIHHINCLGGYVKINLHY